MALFLEIFLGHLLGDFVFQPGRLVKAKRDHPSGLALHVVVVGICTVAVAARHLTTVWPAILAATLSHLVVEVVTIRARRSAEASGLVIFSLDQALHLTALAVIALLFAPAVEPTIGMWPVSLIQLAAACGLFLVTFMGAILAFETRLAVGASEHASGTPLLRMDAARLVGMGERAVALTLALLLASPLAAVAPFAPRVVYALTRSPRERAIHAIDATVGTLVVLGTWSLIMLLVASTS